MKDWRSQAHVKWDCKYHVVILPKYRQQKFFGSARRQTKNADCSETANTTTNQRPLLGAFLIPPALPVVADCRRSGD